MATQVLCDSYNLAEQRSFSGKGDFTNSEATFARITHTLLENPILSPRFRPEEERSRTAFHPNQTSNHASLKRAFAAFVTANKVF
jgi:hypothetical protein